VIRRIKARVAEISRWRKHKKHRPARARGDLLKIEKMVRGAEGVKRTCSGVAGEKKAPNEAPRNGNKRERGGDAPEKRIFGRRKSTRNGERGGWESEKKRAVGSCGFHRAEGGRKKLRLRSAGLEVASGNYGDRLSRRKKKSEISSRATPIKRPVEKGLNRGREGVIVNGGWLTRPAKWVGAGVGREGAGGCSGGFNGRVWVVGEV